MREIKEYINLLLKSFFDSTINIDYDKFGQNLKIERKWIESHFKIPKKCLKDDNIENFVKILKDLLPYDFTIISVDLVEGLYYTINYKYEETDSEYRERLNNLIALRLNNNTNGLSYLGIDKQIEELNEKINLLKLMKDLPTLVIR